ncbi:MAG: lamin tail domain-containing protein, partial [Patescibacteria group bacterium]|nr:lamin tail domain-containing protein [Patescibacteria group bacterium]
MRHYTRLVGVVSVLFILSFVALAPSPANAFWESKLPFKFCERTISAAGISFTFNLPSKKCKEPPPPPPPPEEEPTLEFSASPTTIEEGDSSTLEWDSTDADSCTASGGWSGSKALDGTELVSPSATTTYTLTCEGDGGEVAESVTVNVVIEPAPPTPTLDFTADPETVDQDATSTLEWESTNADSCTASGGWSGSKLLTGSQEVTPHATTTYTLTCEGDGGEVEKSVTVGVILPPELEGKLLITEVLYDLGEGQGAEPSNEWVEIYNGTDAEIDLTGYSITNNNGTDILPGEVLLPADTYLLVIATGNPTSTLEFWDVPETAVIVTLPNATVGGGLTNTRGFVMLVDEASTTIDMVAWGVEDEIVDDFGEVVPDVAAGHSIAREP